MSSAKEKKAQYIEKFASVFEKHTRILVVSCDNIGSAHMQKIRKQLRGQATILMGKNTLMRKAIRMNAERNPKWAALLPAIIGNVGLVFTEGDLASIRDILTTARVPAAAKVGILAPQDVVIPKGQTSLEPTKTSFLQALNIASKINKGTVEIMNDVHLIKVGDKVGPSEAQLLQMLDIRPFTYGLAVQSVYDNGANYGPEILDLKDEDLLKRFASGIANVAALSLATGNASLAAFPHAVLNGYKNLLSIAVATDYTFKQAQKLKDLLSNPEALKAALAAQSASAAPAATKADDKKGAAAPAAVKKEEPKKEEKPESDDMGFDLFG
jgi:large subunit ribosomal protein LP0